jgi:predicted amidohydrolase
MKIYIGQINPTVGALHTNAELIRKAYDGGVKAGADVVMVPELAVTGYPPRDLIGRQIFVDAALEVRDALAAMTGNTALVFGCITRN